MSAANSIITLLLRAGAVRPLFFFSILVSVLPQAPKGEEMHLGLLCNSSSTHARKRFLRTSRKILSNFSGISQRIRHSLRRSWNLGPFAAELTPGTPFLELQHTKKLYGTKNNCVHAQLGQNLHQKIQKGPKKPNCHF